MSKDSPPESCKGQPKQSMSLSELVSEVDSVSAASAAASSSAEPSIPTLAHAEENVVESKRILLFENLSHKSDNSALENSFPSEYTKRVDESVLWKKDIEDFMENYCLAYTVFNLEPDAHRVVEMIPGIPLCLKTTDLIAALSGGVCPTVIDSRKVLKLCKIMLVIFRDEHIENGYEEQLIESQKNAVDSHMNWLRDILIGPGHSSLEPEHIVELKNLVFGSPSDPKRILKLKECQNLITEMELKIVWLNYQTMVRCISSALADSNYDFEGTCLLDIKEDMVVKDLNEVREKPSIYDLSLRESYLDSIERAANKFCPQEWPLYDMKNEHGDLLDSVNWTRVYPSAEVCLYSAVSMLIWYDSMTLCSSIPESVESDTDHYCKMYSNDVDKQKVCRELLDKFPGVNVLSSAEMKSGKYSNYGTLLYNLISEVRQ
jgi:hypothetical protein